MILWRFVRIISDKGKSWNLLVEVEFLQNGNGLHQRVDCQVTNQTESDSLRCILNPSCSTTFEFVPPFLTKYLEKKIGFNMFATRLRHTPANNTKTRK
ncbi:hypothetical protein DVG78_00880 [Runella aurantiaca]|uniref:Uncharacterized protein n=1 Tax=Runella aurantiaca TaxID=2282308 RepID=A0A369ID98_9BACT|nr:hypothetical protein DVG78_00880 [Runella aurantiaca]